MMKVYLCRNQRSYFLMNSDDFGSTLLRCEQKIGFVKIIAIFSCSISKFSLRKDEGKIIDTYQNMYIVKLNSKGASRVCKYMEQLIC